MISIDVLAVGSLFRNEDGSVKEAHSTSTLIRTEKRKILVDTSSKENIPFLKLSFKDLGIFPKEIDTLILTHWHSDHVENINMFPNAKIIVGKNSPAKKKDLVVEEEIQIEENIKIVPTPGHTEDSISVFVTSDKNYAIVGDAIPLEDNFIKKIPPKIAYNEEEAIKSINDIVIFADVIVPGHGLPFTTRR